MNIRFNDIGIQHWAGAFILFLANTHDGIVRGDGAGNFNPDNTVTVGEFCAMAVRAVPSLNAGVNPNDMWSVQAARYINFVMGRGVRVYQGDFTPAYGEQIQRQFAFNIAQRIIGVNAARRANAALDQAERRRRWNALHDRTQIINDARVREGVETLFMHGGIEGRTGNILAPRETLTRAEAAVIIARCLATDNAIEPFARNLSRNFTFHRRIVPPGLANNPNRNLTAINFVTIHNTGNYRAGATAESHANWLFGGSMDGGISRQISWHYTIDRDEIWQSFEDTSACWHAADGSGPGNWQSIGIEICVNFGFVPTGERPQTGVPPESQATPAQLAEATQMHIEACENAAWIVADLLNKHNLTVDRIFQHNHWCPNNQDCPGEIRSGRWGVTWNQFIEMVRERI